jgi:RNA polymerase sigma-70 factor (ECF subfamily)
VSEAPAPEDVRLAEAARQGDRAAFNALISLHKTGLYRLARRFVGNGDDAYDIVQETFVSAWLALSGFNSKQAFGPWIRTILLNKCRDFSRRRAVRTRIMQWLTHAVEAQGEEFVDLEGDEPHDSARLKALDQAIASLPARYKEPLILTALQGLSHREAGDQLGLTPKAVELRVHRARKRLQDLLRSGR